MFGNWEMAFEDVSKLDPEAYPGLSTYLSPGGGSAVADSSDHDVFEFFRAFRDHLR